MKDMSVKARAYIIAMIAAGLALLVYEIRILDIETNWMMGLALAVLASLSFLYKVEGATTRTHYNLSFLVYSFAIFYLGVPWALLIMLVSNMVDWGKHKYPWYIQSFNIAAHAIMLYITGLVYDLVRSGSPSLNLNNALAIAAATLVFILGNHLLVGVVIKLARGQSFAESGVFGTFSIFLDFTVLSMGAVTALIWIYNPFASILNVLPLYLLYNALRVPALERKIENLEKQQVRNPTTA